MRHLLSLACVLCAAAEGTAAEPVIGGAPAPESAPAPAPATEAPPAVAPVTGAAEAPKPTIIDQARGIISSNAQLIAANRTLTVNNGSLTAEIARLTQENATLTAANIAVNGQLTSVQSALDAASAARTDLTTEVTHQLAAAGVPEAALPIANPTASASTQTLEEAVQAMVAESDPEKKGQLAAKVKKLRESSIK